MLSGVASWRGWHIRFTDGICESCLVRFRAEHRRFLESKHPRPVTVTPATASSDAAA